MVSVVGISTSSRADVLAELDRLGTNLLQVQPGRDMFGQNTQLPTDAQAMIRRIARCRIGRRHPHRTDHGAAQRQDLDRRSRVASRSSRPSRSCSTRSVRRCATGRFLDDAFVKYPAVVLGSEAAKRLGIHSLDGQPIVDIGGNWFEVVGILDPVPLAADIDRSVLIGYDVAQQLFGIDDDGIDGARPHRARCGRRGAGRARGDDQPAEAEQRERDATVRCARGESIGRQGAHRTVARVSDRSRSSSAASASPT